MYGTISTENKSSEIVWIWKTEQIGIEIDFWKPKND